MKAVALVATFSLATLPSISAEYKYDAPTHTVTITGDIDHGDYVQKFEPLVKDIKDLKQIIITSDGGSFDDGLKIGLYAHNNDLIVDARDYCFSSCAFIWLGGTGHVLSTDTPMLDQTIIGIHMPFNSETGETDPIGIGLSGWYFASVGLSNKAVEDISEVNQPSMYMIGQSATSHWGIGNVSIIHIDPSKPVKPVTNLPTDK